MVISTVTSNYKTENCTYLFPQKCVKGENTMSKLNKAAQGIKTHNGAPAKNIDAEAQLRRSVMSCLLWEKEYYENGKKIADRIAELVPKVAPDVVADMAIYARNVMNLRHVPLYLTSLMAKLPSHRQFVRRVVGNVVNRPDELGELLAMYFGQSKKTTPIASSLKKGLADAFCKFNEYQLAKYNREEGFKLRDVLFLTHPKPANAEQELLWKKLIGGFCKNCGKSHYSKDTKKVELVTETCSNYEEMRLSTPDTWEVALSSGGNKKSHWTRLLEEGKLGALALLRNLRNMREAGVAKDKIENAFSKVNLSKVLPYRYIAAAKYAPYLEDVLEKAMFRSLLFENKMEGRTVLLLDVSGSMDRKLSDKSDLDRIDAACGLAMLLREICEEVDIYTFSRDLKHIAPRHGFALRDAIVHSQEHGSTYLGSAVKAVYAKEGSNVPVVVRSQQINTFKGQGLSPDRLIVITDEQSDDVVPNPSGVGYMINVASNKNGVGYGAWTHVDGFSESVVRWIQEMES